MSRTLVIAGITLAFFVGVTAGRWIPGEQVLEAQKPGDVEKLRTDLMGEISNVRKDLTGEINNVRKDLMGELQNDRRALIELRSTVQNAQKSGLLFETWVTKAVEALRFLNPL